MSDRIDYLEQEADYIARMRHWLQSLQDQHRERVLELMEEPDAPHGKLAELLLKLKGKE